MIGTSHQAFSAWYSQGSNLLVSIADTTTTSTSLNNNLLVRPSYYANYDGVTATLAGGTAFADTGTNVINTTGTGTNGKKYIISTTFRVGSNWMTTSTDNWQAGFGVYDVTNSNGTQAFRQSNAYKAKNWQNIFQYGFSIGDGGDVQINEDIFDANYRNRWLTYLAATSDNPTADFANWSGGTTDYGNTGWATRAYLIDVQAGTVIGTNDNWNYGQHNSPDLTQTWTIGFGSSSYALNHFVYFMSDISLYHRNDVDFLSHWYSIGNNLDPSVYWPYFVGTGVGGTVGGVKSWVRWIMGGSGNLVTNTVDVGYKYNIGSQGSRLPSGTVLSIYANNSAQSAQTIPTFTSL